jgi:Rhodopirellula transposase DDE domain
MIDTSVIRDRFVALAPHLDERGRRSFAAAEARSAGYGGIAAVARATGIAPSTIGRGLAELAGTSAVPADRTRRVGGGRKALTATDPALLEDLLALVSPSERGDPMSPLRWTCKGLRRLASELRAIGHKISHTVVGELLKGEKFSLQANRKTREGDSHPDRDAQFAHISACTSHALAEQQPVISVDTKKKELVGDFKNAGREWRPQGDPEEVRVHDFLIKELGRAVPYGIYDLAANTGWVSVGIDHDTAEFAVQTIRSWWHSVGRKRYPNARYLTITADGGGSNGSRVRLWKRELQRLANELGIDIRVHHLPPGTSKWNKIEHRLFSFISMNWRAKPLVSYRVIVDLISATTTETGLTVQCELDTNIYPKGIVVTDQEMAQLNIVHDEFHGEWNYTLRNRNSRDRAVNS